MLCLDTPSANTGLLQLPKVSSAFKQKEENGMPNSNEKEPVNVSSFLSCGNRTQNDKECNHTRSISFHFSNPLNFIMTCAQTSISTQTKLGPPLLVTERKMISVCTTIYRRALTYIRAGFQFETQKHKQKPRNSFLFTSDLKLSYDDRLKSRCHQFPLMGLACGWLGWLRPGFLTGACFFD